MAFNLNQFKLTNRVGEVMNPAANVIQAMVLPSLAAALYYSAGQAVSWGTNSGDVPVVRNVYSGAVGCGVIVYNMKSDKYAAKAIVGVALDGSTINVSAASAITRGDVVGWGSTGFSTVAAGITAYGLAIALDNASTNGDIIRVLIKAGVRGTSSLAF